MITQKKICSYCDGEGTEYPDVLQPQLSYKCSPCKGSGFLVIDVEERIKDLEEDIRDATEELIDLKMFLFENLQ